MSKSNSMMKNSFLYMLSMVIPKIVALLMIPIFSYYIVPEEQGIYAYTQNVVTVFNIFSVLGLNVYYLRYYTAKEKEVNFSGTFFWFIVLWNAILLGIGTPAFWFVWNTAGIEFPFFPYMFMALVHNFMLALEIIPMRAYRMNGEVNVYFRKIMIKTVISTGIAIWLVFFCKMGIMGRYWADIISSAVLGVLFIIYMLQNSQFGIDVKELKEGLKFSLPILPANIIQVSEPLVKSVIIERMFPLAELGIYSMGASLANMISVLSQSVSMAVEPEIYARADKPEYMEYMNKIKKMYMVLGIIGGLFFGIFIREAVYICLSDSYYESWRVVQPLVISYVLAMLTGLLSSMIIIQNRGKLLVWVNLSYLIITIIGSVLVLKISNVSMLGWVNVAGQLMMIVVLYSLLRKGLTNTFKLRWDMLYITIMCVVLIFTNSLNQLQFIVCVCVKLLVWLAGSYITLICYGYSIKDVKQLIIGFIKRKG